MKKYYEYIFSGTSTISPALIAETDPFSGRYFAAKRITEYAILDLPHIGLTLSVFREQQRQKQ